MFLRAFNVVLAEASYQNVRSFIILRSGEGFNLLLSKMTVLTFLMKKLSKNKPFRGVWFLRICEKTLLQSRLRSTKSTGRNPQIKVLYQKEKVKVSD